MTPATRRQHWARLALGLLVLVAAQILLRGYVTDDTYIHLRYAENLLAHGEFSFNPGESTYGATSPLWILGLAALLELGLAGPAAAWTLGLISGALLVVVLAGLLRRLPFSEPWRWWLFALGIADAWFLRWTMSGMETPLATVALLVLLWPLVMRSREEAGDPQSARLWPRYLAWGLAAGLAGLVRPEFLLLAPVALPWLLLFEYRRGDALAGAPGRHRARPHRPLVVALVGWVMSAGPWIVYAQLTFGRWTPGTASAKSGEAVFDVVAVVQSLLRSLQQLGLTQGVIWIFFLVLVAIVLVERRNQERGRIRTSGVLDAGDWEFWQAVCLVLVVFTWSVVLLGGYAVKQVWTISRYLSPLSPAILLMLGVLAFWLLNVATPYRGQRPLRTWVAPLACGLAIAGNVALLAGPIRGHARDFSRGVVECYLEKGEWLGDHAAPGEVIAALDIGAIAYGADRPVLDLMGLVSPEIMVLGRRMGFQEMVESGAWLRTDHNLGQPPAWFVDRHEGSPRWDGRTVRGVTFELVDTCTIHGVGLREPQDWTVATYRLHRDN
ncbi:hypothetical protein GF314_09480 [bacterium]|nr:hypothetical protein [bacterium]